jgi:hypothetical protein
MVMKSLQKLISSLKADLKLLEDEKITQIQKLRILSKEKETKIIEIINHFIPDTSRKTMFQIRSIFFDFKFKTKFKFGDFYEVINTSLENLRNEFKNYLQVKGENIRFYSDSIISIEKKIYHIESNILTELDRKIITIKEKIEVYKILQKMDLTYMNPILKEKIESFKNPVKFGLTKSDSIILEIWFRHELFCNNSPLKNELLRLENLNTETEDNIFIFLPKGKINYEVKRTSIKKTA